jgi:hypothetical protein
MKLNLYSTKVIDFSTKLKQCLNAIQMLCIEMLKGLRDIGNTIDLVNFGKEEVVELLQTYQSWALT